MSNTQTSIEEKINSWITYVKLIKEHVEIINYEFGDEICFIINGSYVEINLFRDSFKKIDKIKIQIVYPKYFKYKNWGYDKLPQKIEEFMKKEYIDEFEQELFSL